MLGLGHYLYNTFSQAVFGAAASSESGARNNQYDMEGQYHPSVEDVLAVKEQLVGQKLPLEIVDTVIDFAEYWPHTTTHRGGATNTTNHGVLNLPAGRASTENYFLLRSYPLGYIPTENDPTVCKMESQDSFPTIPPLPRSIKEDEITHTRSEEIKQIWLKSSQARVEFPCRKIVFTLKSHDQGWGGDARHKGTYKGSYTWFDVGLEKMTVFRANQLRRSDLDDNLDIGNDASRQGDNENIEDYIADIFQAKRLPIFPETTTSSLSEIDKPPNICTVRVIIPETIPLPTHDNREAYQFSHHFMPTETCLQRNLTATRDMKTHTIIWRYTDSIQADSLEAAELDSAGRGIATGRGEFVRNMKIGDVVTVWSKSRFGGWCNCIEEVKIDVYWAV